MIIWLAAITKHYVTCCTHTRVGGCSLFSENLASAPDFPILHHPTKFTRLYFVVGRRLLLIAWRKKKNYHYYYYSFIPRDTHGLCGVTIVTRGGVGGEIETKETV